MIIQEGEKIPLFYDKVYKRPDVWGIEVQPIPYCWIKRWWIKHIDKLDWFDWERQIMNREEEIYQKGYEDGKEEAQKINEKDLEYIKKIIKYGKITEKHISED